MTRMTGFAFSLFLVAGCTASPASSLALDQPLRITGDAAGAGTVRVHLSNSLGGVPTVPSPVESVVRRLLGATSTASTSGSDLVFAPGRTALAIDATRTPIVESASVALGDLHFEGGSLPPNGLDLRDLSLVLKSPARVSTVRADEDLLSLAGTAMLALHWSLVLDDGSLYRLGPVDVGPVELHAAVRRDESGEVASELALFCDDCADVPGLFQLSNGMVDVTVPVEIAAP